MQLVVRKAKRLEHSIPERSPQQGPTVIPTTLMKPDRTNSHPSKLMRQTETMQHPRCVRADLNPRTHFAQRSRPLVHMHIKTRPQQ